MQTVIDAMVAEAKTRLDEKVAAGELTQEEADQKLAELTERITDSVNNGMPARGDHGPGGRPEPTAPTADGTTDTTAGLILARLSTPSGRVPPRGRAGTGFRRPVRPWPDPR